MFVKMKSTRHTKIGTLRAGVVYSAEQLGRKAEAVLGALVKAKNPAAVVLTAAQAAAEKAAVASLMPAGVAGAPGQPDKGGKAAKGDKPAKADTGEAA